MREKVTKERTFVRIELPLNESEKDNVFRAATDARSSGGIVMLFAKMWLYEIQFAAGIAFEQGYICGGGLRLPYYQIKMERVTAYNDSCSNPFC